MPLSSNSIIHFTSDADSLKGILEKNFQIFFCRETVRLCGKKTDYYVPMVSFCDIPLSEIKDHIGKYGPYGIGLTKEWAEKRGLNPVLYLEENSLLAKSYQGAFMSQVMDADEDVDEWSDNQRRLVDVLRYIKNYRGDLFRKGALLKDYRFSDEREWRYVPAYDSSCDMILHRNYYRDSNNKVEADSKLDGMLLEFEPNDIKYIIIKNDAEISDFVDVLKKAKGKNYSYHDVERLTTRILTSEQILSDI